MALIGQSAPVFSQAGIEEPAVALYFYRLAGCGGAERMICQLADALSVRGFRVILVSLDDPETRAFFPIGASVQWWRLGHEKGVAGKLRRTRRLARLLKANSVSALVGFVMSADKTIYAAAKMAGIRLVAAERNAPSMYRLRYGLARRWMVLCLLHLVDRIVVQMPSYAAGYPSSLRRRITAISNPVPKANEVARPDRPGRHGRFTLLTVSRLDAAQKRIGLLVEAFARIAGRFPDWDLRIVGDGPEEAAVRARIGELGLCDRVLMEPPVVDVFAAYAQAHLFALPSLWEGFPNALAEAMSHGLPAVGFEEAQGVADLIRIGGGWLASPADEMAFAETLASAMADPDGRAARGRLAAEGMARFEPQRQFDQWAALLASLLSGGAR